MFGHDRFEAYQLAIKFVAHTTSIFATIPTGNANIVDQLKRASISVPLNIAEGSGKTTSIDKKCYYAIARGSAMECAALLDVLVALDLVHANSIEPAKKILHSIVSILSAVCLAKDKGWGKV